MTPHPSPNTTTCRSVRGSAARVAAQFGGAVRYRCAPSALARLQQWMGPRGESGTLGGGRDPRCRMLGQGDATRTPQPITQQHRALLRVRRLWGVGGEGGSRAAPAWPVRGGGGARGEHMAAARGGGGEEVGRMRDARGTLGTVVPDPEGGGAERGARHERERESARARGGGGREPDHALGAAAVGAPRSVPPRSGKGGGGGSGKGGEGRGGGGSGGGGGAGGGRGAPVGPGQRGRPRPCGAALVV